MLIFQWCSCLAENADVGTLKEVAEVVQAKRCSQITNNLWCTGDFPTSLGTYLRLFGMSPGTTVKFLCSSSMFWKNWKTRDQQLHSAFVSQCGTNIYSYKVLLVVAVAAFVSQLWSYFLAILFVHSVRISCEETKTCTWEMVAWLLEQCLGTSARWSPYSRTAPLSWPWDFTCGPH